MLEKQVTLTTGTLLNLIRRRDGEPHTVLSSTPVWLSEEAQRAEDERTNAELARYGLAGRRGIDPGFIAVVEAIARPQLEYFAWVDGGFEGKPLKYTLLAGSAGGEAFVLARNPEAEGVVLASVRPEEVLTEFLAQIPNLAPGKGNRLVVPKSEATGNRRGPAPSEDNFSVMRDSRPNAGAVEAEELRRVLSLRRLGGGSLYVAVRNRSGRRQRIDRPVNYIDTVEGRWLTEEVPGAGEPSIAFTPATPQELAGRLRAAQARLSG
ncbi:ESX secretion-associated protein EspG [Amycolatopsis sp. 195334CR]|uniref:ESX secretion-associated protein EspG n=1 Tax=Amycolatopsis sp. 195334CR TaxID=2814588 RepID=UPI001A8ED8DE|nr:ESX secretion-associated protein EspG [Amycolatopsis sp. 195334CR]MBN6035654.1 ESX secretion-associated protein EspG [Amycolatopsis sp. 195334CR]